MTRIPAHPKRAVAYFRGERRRSNAIPAIVWLFVLTAVIVTLRQGRVPSATQALTLAFLGFAVVAVGVFLPELVTLILAGTLVAGVLGAPQVLPALNWLNARVAGLTGGGQ